MLMGKSVQAAVMSLVVREGAVAWSLTVIREAEAAACRLSFERAQLIRRAMR